MKNEVEKTVLHIKRIIDECPWGKEETLEKHVEELMKELNELKEAIKKNDKKNLKEELGDVFYDSLFLLLLAEKENNINPMEVIKNVREKIEKRSPWVFGDVKANTKEDALEIWNKIKQKEKAKI